jgi:ribosomal protein L32
MVLWYSSRREVLKITHFSLDLHLGPCLASCQSRSAIPSDPNSHVPHLHPLLVHSTTSDEHLCTHTGRVSHHRRKQRRKRDRVTFAGLDPSHNLEFAHSLNNCVGSYRGLDSFVKLNYVRIKDEPFGTKTKRAMVRGIKLSFRMRNILLEVLISVADLHGTSFCPRCFPTVRRLNLHAELRSHCS